MEDFEAFQGSFGRRAPGQLCSRKTMPDERVHVPHQQTVSRSNGRRCFGTRRRGRKMENAGQGETDRFNGLCADGGINEGGAAARREAHTCRLALAFM